MALSQASRDIAVATPLGDDIVVLLRMTGTEQLGRLFNYELDLLSESPELDLDDLLGQNVTARIERLDGETRYFNGYVSSCSQVGAHGRLTLYRATLRPWLWFLTRTADCRIFQEMKVPDIVKQVFRDHGLTDFQDSLSGTYRTWEYCVQYRETDFNFVSRLLEQEGIYYYFEHENGKHTLVLADGYSSHSPIAGYEEVPYFPPDAGARREREHVYDWLFSRDVQPGAYALNDFDFKVPKKSLLARKNVPRKHANADYEIYDYPGDYAESADGDAYATVRIEEQQARHERARALGDARGLFPGGLFSLVDFPREDQNREYLIVAGDFEIQNDEYQVESGVSAAPEYACSVEVIGAQQPFRASRVTRKPVIQGPQTAIVVGPKGEEIHTDEHGRIKVQFHWDRYGKADENSSCWVRVAQIWAGKKWGAMYLPRCGQEVIVEFLEGDPDHPIITGRVYNGDNKPPYDLPGDKTLSTLKSNSSKGGGGFNELRFEDKKDDEQIYLHAQKNFDIRVLNDRFETVLNDRHLVVEKDKMEQVKKDRHETVDGAHQEKIAGDRSLQVAGKEAVAIDGSKSLHVKGDVHEVFDGNHGEEVASDYYVKASNLVIEGSSNITLKVGGSFIAIESSGIKIKSSGAIEIDAGSNLTAKAGASAEVKAGATLTAEGGAGFTVKGATGTVDGGGALTLKGGVVKIN